MLFLLASTSSVAVPRAEEWGFDVALPGSHRPYLEIAALRANSENAHRTLASADELTGLDQILELTSGSRFEEQWAYLHALGLWIEIGINERSSDRDAEVEIDLAYLRRVASSFPDLHLVHFHPASYYPVVLPASAPAADMQDGIAAIGYALPSPTDVLSSIRLMELLRSDNPEVKVELSVVSPHGVVAYGLTERGLATIAYEGNNPRAGTARSIVTRLAVRRMQFNITKTFDTLGEASIAEVIAELCAQASDENYFLVYSPLPPKAEPPTNPAR